MYARDPSVLGAMLVLGIIAALAMHLVLGARQLLGGHRDRQQMALSPHPSMSKANRAVPQHKRLVDATPASDLRSREERTAVLRAVGRAVVSAIQIEAQEYAAGWSDLFPVDVPITGRSATGSHRQTTSTLPPAAGPARAAANRQDQPWVKTVDTSVPGPLAQSLLKALLSKSYTLDFQKHSYQRSYSLKHLHDSGALEDNLAGYRRLVDLAYGTDHRSVALKSLYDVSPTKWIDAQAAAVRSAQRYLREYGSRLVLQGLLDP